MSTPVLVDGRHIIRHVSNEDVIKATSSKCKIEALYSTICLIRRDFDYYDLFVEKLRADFWYFKYQLSERVLISILDTFADNSNKEAAIAVAIIRGWQIGQSAYTKSKEYKFRKLWPTTFTVHPKRPDTITNHYRRMAKSIRTDPLVWLIFYEIFERAVKTKNIPIVPISKALKKSSKIDLLSIVSSILMPTTILPKYAGLYSELHYDRKGYGSRAIVHPKFQQVLDRWSSDTILNFGCGKGLIAGVTNYDPAFGDKIPNGPFDALVSFDVLEHVPEEELPLVSEWFRLLSNRLLLGISTRKAKAILPNGENAHCTVHGHQWWEKCFRDMMPDYKSSTIDVSTDYVMLSLDRTS